MATLYIAGFVVMFVAMSRTNSWVFLAAVWLIGVGMLVLGVARVSHVDIPKPSGVTRVVIALIDRPFGIRAQTRSAGWFMIFVSGLLIVVFTAGVALGVFDGLDG